MATLKLSMLAWLRDRDFYNPEKFAAFAAALKRDADVVFPVPKPVPQAVSSASSTAGGTHTSANAHASAGAATHGSDSERASELNDFDLWVAPLARGDVVKGVLICPAQLMRQTPCCSTAHFFCRFLEHVLF